MINKEQFQRYVIEAALLSYDKVKPGAYSANAVALLMGTAAHESKMGTYLVQMGDGPAKGFFQVEQATAIDNWVNYLRYHQDQADFIRSIISPLAANDIFTPAGKVADNIEPTRALDRELTTNLAYNCLMARIKYMRDSQPLPDANNSFKMAEYWKRVFNTEHGAGTVEEFVLAYEDYVL